MKESEIKLANEWIVGGDTGTSSITIWSVMMRSSIPQGRCDIPYDFADFGRCHRLLETIPSWRERMPEVSEISARWRPLVERWSFLTAVYLKVLRSGQKHDAVYDEIAKLRNGGAS